MSVVAEKPMSDPKQDKESDSNQLSEKDIAQRRDTALKRMLNTPPKPHKNLTDDNDKPKDSK